MGDFAVIPVLIFAVELGIRITFVLLILLRKPGDSTSRIAWLVVVLLIPFFGALAYLLVGEVRLGRRRIKRHETVVLRQSAMASAVTRAPPASIADIQDPFGQIASLAESVAGNYPIAGNEIDLLGDANQMISSIVADIGCATQHVHLVTYIYLADETGKRIAQAMREAQQRGVTCRVLVDDVGSRDFLHSPLCEQMRSGGIQVIAALPANPLRALFNRVDLRNHRKIVVIDGHIGYTGSRNIADAAFLPKKRFAPWVDAMVRLHGPIVRDLQRLFIEDWYLDTDDWIEEAVKDIKCESVPDGIITQVVGTGPNAFNHAMRNVFQAAIHLARREIVLTTPYFVPDDSTVSALRTCARRGVDTVVVVPKKNDALLVAAASRGFYEMLLDSGVRIHEFHEGLLHAKTMTVDHDLAIVSSANLDKRSLFLNFEASVIVYDTDFASRLRFLQQSYIDASTEVFPAHWSRRSWPQRLAHNAAGMLSPLL